jgi:hypothetical protein
MATALGKTAPKHGFQQKAVALNMELSFIANVSETE